LTYTKPPSDKGSGPCLHGTSDTCVAVVTPDVM